MAAGVTTRTVHYGFQHVIDADQTKDFQKVALAVIQYLQAHPDKNFADVETKLRTKKCFSRLIAREPQSGIVPCLHEKKCSYELFVTTKIESEAMKELVHFAIDEATNLERLKDTGFLWVNSPIQQEQAAVDLAKPLPDHVFLALCNDLGIPFMRGKILAAALNLSTTQILQMYNLVKQDPSQCPLQ